jgi:hypothetical protein
MLLLSQSPWPQLEQFIVQIRANVYCGNGPSATYAKAEVGTSCTCTMFTDLRCWIYSYLFTGTSQWNWNLEYISSIRITNSNWTILSIICINLHISNWNRIFVQSRMWNIYLIREWIYNKCTVINIRELSKKDSKGENSTKPTGTCPNRVHWDLMVLRTVRWEAWLCEAAKGTQN